MIDTYLETPKAPNNTNKTYIVRLIVHIKRTQINNYLSSIYQYQKINIFGKNNENKYYFINEFDQIEYIDPVLLVWKFPPKNIYQACLLSLLINEDLDLITVQSMAGYGKTFLSLAAAFYLVFQLKKYSKIIFK